MQEFIYHKVPEEMIGDKLIPLNSLGKTYPHLYEEYTKKYFDHPERPKLLKNKSLNLIVYGMMSSIFYRYIHITFTKLSQV